MCLTYKSCDVLPRLYAHASLLYVCLLSAFNNLHKLLPKRSFYFFIIDRVWWHGRGGKPTINPNRVWCRVAGFDNNIVNARAVFQVFFFPSRNFSGLSFVWIKHSRVREGFSPREHTAAIYYRLKNTVFFLRIFFCLLAFSSSHLAVAVSQGNRESLHPNVCCRVNLSRHEFITRYIYIYHYRYNI